MFKYYAICGQNKDDGKWYVRVALKATSRQEITDLLQQYIESHVQGNEYIAYRIDDIKGVKFEDYAKGVEVRCLISKSAAKLTEERGKMLADAP